MKKGLINISVVGLLLVLGLSGCGSSSSSSSNDSNTTTKVVEERGGFDAMREFAAIVHNTIETNSSITLKGYSVSAGNVISSYIYGENYVEETVTLYANNQCEYTSHIIDTNGNQYYNTSSSCSYDDLSEEAISNLFRFRYALPQNPYSNTVSDFTVDEWADINKKEILINQSANRALVLP